MTKEDKQLLLVDLCARLPYSPFVKLMEKYDDDDSEYFREIHNLSTYDIELFNSGEISNIKPYLRPMSSMTEEELYEVQEILGKEAEIRDGFISIIDSSIISFTYLELQAVFEWFNTYHFDYRGLIPKGLAIEVTEENNPYKD